MLIETHELLTFEKGHLCYGGKLWFYDKKVNVLYEGRLYRTFNQISSLCHDIKGFKADG